ncbi:MAG: DNA polymerase Y family protein [Hydrogenophaga sp.]|uniref:Y-family DNA polymerase n=1 Tax=Hydrogenophaga sp. TaxID=1904254 RepID=UPI003D1080E3
MLWSALLPSPLDGTAPRTEATQRALATWALQFTPRVALVEEAVLMEVEASVRLFGGQRALRNRVLGEGRELGVAQLAWAPNGLAALALARAGIENGFKRPLDALLDTLPMAVLSAVHPHRLTLERIGCRTLGDVRALPRSGIGRRFDQHLLKALDQAYGFAPEVHEWMTLPDAFEERLELMARVEQAPALLFGARRLLRLLSGWLAARRAGVTAFTLKWAHDAMRARAAGEGGEITIRTAEPTRDIEHLCRLLAEHLARVELPAPVGDLVLVATEVQPLHDVSASLLPDALRQGEKLGLVLERLSARLGPQRVLRPVLREDHRPEWMCRWQPAALPLPRLSASATDLPQPGFVLPAPLRLLLRGHRPLYEGELLLLLGPQRVEGGWWDRVGDEDRMRNVVRDYWVALSPQAGVLWVFQTRQGWYLHGHFA